MADEITHGNIFLERDCTASQEGIVVSFFHFHASCIYGQITDLFFRQVDGTAPTFVTKPTIRQDADGTTLVFHCSIYADPKPVVSWFHNGDKVQDNKKFQVNHAFL